MLKYNESTGMFEEVDAASLSTIKFHFPKTSIPQINFSSSIEHLVFFVTSFIALFLLSWLCVVSLSFIFGLQYVIETKLLLSSVAASITFVYKLAAKYFKESSKY